MVLLNTGTLLEWITDLIRKKYCMKYLLLPWWVWATALVINVGLLFFNLEGGNEDFIGLNVLSLTACLLGLLAFRPSKS